jgi:tubulin polyglutamylase TTLL5
MQQKFSKEEFDIIPESFILPDDFSEFFEVFESYRKTDKLNNNWIVKPAASSRGRGIFISNDINDFDVEQKSVVCRYISNPFLINSHKFDLRIYIIITSFDPLRIYMFKDGLARFASEKYNQENPNNRFSHLTNYSINKKNKKFIQNQHEDKDDYGYKWVGTNYQFYVSK